jgi:acyl dehydratase
MLTRMGDTGTLSEDDFATPIEQRYLEDYRPGAVYEYGYRTLTEDELLDFARRFDPQPMHVDPEFAKNGPFGGLIASGWHTAGLMMRLFTQHFLSPVSSLASPGIDELRWPRPIRSGDVLSIRVTVTEARRSRSKPQQGVVHSFVEVLNQHGEVVMTLKPVSFIRCRPA